MEGAVLSRRAGGQGDSLYDKCVVCLPQLEFYLLNYLAILYLHGVCFSRGGLPIGKDSPIVSTQYIYNEKRRKPIKKKKSKKKTMWIWRKVKRVPNTARQVSKQKDRKADKNPDKDKYIWPLLQRQIKLCLRKPVSTSRHVVFQLA